MKHTAKLHLERNGKVTYGVIVVTKPTPLQALRAIERKREELWLAIGPRLEAGETLHISLREGL